MIPFVAAGGLLIALGFLLAGYPVALTNPGSGNSWAKDWVLNNSLFNLPTSTVADLNGGLSGYLGAVLFFLVIDVQTVLGYGALQAGMATLPITVLMLLLASRGGALGTRIGPRIPMTVGPLVMAVGVAWLSFVEAGTSYWLVTREDRRRRAEARAGGPPQAGADSADSGLGGDRP